jgi:hypothetical protein
MLVFTPLLATRIFPAGMSHLYLNTNVPDDRQYGFRDRCSRLVLINETITIPDGYLMVNDPVKVDYDGEAAAYNGTLQQKGNTLELSQEIILEKRVYEPADWPAVKKAVIAQKNMADQPIVLSK